MRNLFRNISWPGKCRGKRKFITSGRDGAGRRAIPAGRRNQFAKSIKIPAADKEYQCISVLLTTDRLQQFALDNDIVCEKRYQGSKNILLGPDNMLKGYFLSVIPYTESG
jgi:hypothetical protein